MLALSENISVSGRLCQKDIKSLTKAMRGATVGPTTLYYAGVTAPVIGAGMALEARRAFSLLEMSVYWQTLCSGIVAAMAGIVWYLIFMRWAYRHHHGRGSEMTEISNIHLGETGLSIRRGGIETRIDWSAVTGLIAKRRFLLIRFDGADPLIVPNSWFNGDTKAREAFRARIEKASGHGAQS